MKHPHCVRISITVILLFIFLTQLPTSYARAATFTAESDARSLILIEAETGAVLYEKDADIPLPPASVTKVMTMLLVMEAIDSGKIKYEDTVLVSEYAAEMGGSQVYLEAGEQMSVHELLKCLVVSSANDAAVALAEHICGSEESFVAEMNKRAHELGMNGTVFENTNGLDDTTHNHVTTARDIATMSAELITKHPKILEYSSIWLDSIRGGEFGLTNTNRLIRFYNGANGLRTGSTAKAGFCISASAKRDGMQLICVVMAAKTRDSRNEIAKKLLDFGFAGYRYIEFPSNTVEAIPVKGGTKDKINLEYGDFKTVIEKTGGTAQAELILPEHLTAPINEGDTIGTVRYTLNGETIAELPITAAESTPRIDFKYQFLRLLKELLY